MPTENSAPPSSRRLWIALAVVTLGVLAAVVWINVRVYLANYGMDHPLPPELPVRNAPFITSSDAVVDKMVEMAELTPDDVAYDLGCGDGRIIITAALKTGCRGIGFEIDPEIAAKA